MIYVDDLIVNPEEAAVVPPRAEQSLSEMGLSITHFDPGDSTAGQSGSEPKTRTITLDLVCREDSEASLPEAAYRLQQIVGQMQEEPETWIKRVPKVGGDWAGPVMYRIRRSPTAEEPQVTLSGLGGWQVGDNQPVTLTMVADYPAYATEEVEGEEHSTTEDRQLIYTEDAPGGSTKGLRRIRVTNDNEEGDWRGLIFASECRDYDSAETAEPWYECQDLTVRGGSEPEEGLIQSQTLTKGWQTILSTEIVGVGHMTHRGGRRIWMRVADLGTEPEDIQLRLIWRALGASRWEEENPIVTVLARGVGNWFLADLGSVLPGIAAQGDQRWEGKVMARALSGSGSVFLRDFYPLPTEQYLKVSEIETAPVDGEPTTLPNSATDSSATGTVEWSNPSYVVTPDEELATASLTAGKESHYLIAKDFELPVPEGATIKGIRASVLCKGSTAGIMDGSVEILKGGVRKTLVDKASDTIWSAGRSFRLYGGADDLWGQTWAQSDVVDEGFGIAISASGVAPATAEIDAIFMTVWYTEADNEPVVCTASRQIELRSNGVERQAPADEVWGTVMLDGFLPYAYPGALEDRTQRTIIIPTQGDLKERADAGVPNKLTAREFNRAAYHVAREAG